MSKEWWRTGWDPEQALKIAEANIQQLAAAYNELSEHTQNLTKVVNHQQEVLQQIVFQNKKLEGRLNALDSQRRNDDTTRN